MKATVLIDNRTKSKLLKEWGLSIYIEYKDQVILLDTGASDRFISNAYELGIDLEEVDYAVLSHAHYDHADGMKPFFQTNDRAPFYLRDACAENCYGKKFIFSRYIGIPKGILDQYKNRIQFVSGDYQVNEGVYLIPHKTEGLESIGKANHMYIKNKRKWQPDAFAHEQSLVFETEKGLVIFNSCSHGGADTIIKEVQKTFPKKKIYALIGGFHLFDKKKEEVQKLAQGILETGIEKVYTGHCTGARAYGILKEELGERLQSIYTGLVMEF